MSVRIKATLGPQDFPVKGFCEVEWEFEVPDIIRVNDPPMYQAGKLVLRIEHAEGFLRLVGGHSFALAPELEVVMA